ncbi:hypothetical protein FE782_03735 [Paenibacillus antri]|uniref:Uncharacterized protein n=1 Tax=Paenibacillus antri TaxID=2582848 RepID=A0A5R9GKA9_9BACL|nr:hypothetical protein [Paenibacillus antri]TLS53393.1 hypothetical protein FE782_03735 [Paenibacillus antri]
MSKFYLPSQLEKMKEEARISGDPRKHAQFHLARQEYLETRSQLFSGEDTPYLDAPNDEGIRMYEERAKSGEPDDELRYRIIKDRYDFYKNIKDGGTYRSGIEARKRLEEIARGGVEFTNAEIEELRRHVAKNPTAENLAHMAIAKRRLETKDFEAHDAQETKREVTEADVQKAHEKAQRTSAPQDIASYATIKRQYESQNTENAS